ncbi:MAG: A/G-specific adenine glycosylase [Candidatus Eisenbacteria bacterium]
MGPKACASFRQRLLAWYDRARRDLPWRRTRDPYAIWVSEVMLQQTRVEAVIPYYERFLRAFPTPRDLAAAPEEEVLALWSGLGYYSRARNLRAGAGLIAERGEFPREWDEARALPGIGDYTAAAVLSIAFDRPHAVVDGNVARVLARWLTLDPPHDRPASLKSLAAELLDAARPGDWNQAMMELGATVCTPRGPSCADCPVEADCRARATQAISRYPRPRARPTPVEVRGALLLLRDARGHLYLERGRWRLLPTLWIPPVLEGLSIEATLFAEARSKSEGWQQSLILGGRSALDAILARSSATTIGVLQHSITHHKIRLEVARVECHASGVDSEEGRWLSTEELSRLGRSSLLQKALRVEEGWSR